MKLSVFFTLCTVAGAVAFVACNEDPAASTPSAKEQSAAKADVADVAEVTTAGKCLLASYSFKLPKMTRTMNYRHTNGRLTSVETVTAGVAQPQLITYEYDQSGKLTAFTVGKNHSVYRYNDDGQLEAIVGEGNLMPRTFEYNEAGQITRQATMMGGEPYATLDYTYDEAGTPIKAIATDKTGTVTEEYSFEYDSNPNPFIGSGIMANATEMLYGLPVANHTNNLTSVTTTYKKASSKRVNGAIKQAGESDTRSFELTYNEQGYPLSNSTSRNGRTLTANMTYSCK